jgi:chromosomal replication initiator protein
MYLCRERLKLPFQGIGKIFSRDHSTVMSSVKQIQQEIDKKNNDVLEALVVTGN